MLALIILVGIVVFTPVKIFAATINVTVTADEDSEPVPGTGCSLYEAFRAVDTQAAYGGCIAGNGTNDTIVVPSGTYQMINNDLSLSSSANIIGETNGTTIIEGDGNETVIALSDGTFVLEDLVVGGGTSGISVTSGGANANFTLRRLTIDQNSSEGILHAHAGGDFESTLSVYDSIIRNSYIGINTLSGSDEYNVSTNVNNALIEDNSGAGFYSLTLSDDTIENVTLRDNGYGAISTRLTMTNTLIYENNGGVATYDAGPSGQAHNLTNVSIVNNLISDSGPGFDLALNALSDGDTPYLNLTNVIVANNTADDLSPISQCQGTDLFQTLVQNMSSDDSCTSFTYTNTDPLHENTLANNGGVRQIGAGGAYGDLPTLALLILSPAINNGTNIGCPATDIRSVSRPQGASCDIGAYELLATSFSDSEDSEEGLQESGSLADTNSQLENIVITGTFAVLSGSLLIVRLKLEQSSGAIKK